MWITLPAWPILIARLGRKLKCTARHGGGGLLYRVGAIQNLGYGQTAWRIPRTGRAQSLRPSLRRVRPRIFAAAFWASPVSPTTWPTARLRGCRVGKISRPRTKRISFVDTCSTPTADAETNLFSPTNWTVSVSSFKVSFGIQAPSLRSDPNFVDLDPEVKDHIGFP